MNVGGYCTWPIQMVTVVLSASPTAIFSATTGLAVGLWFHRGLVSLGISLYPRQECVPPSVGLSTEQSLRSVALAGLGVVLYGCVAGWLALASACGISPDGRRNGADHVAENPIKKQFQALALRRWSAPVRQGTRAKPFCTSITPKLNLFTRPCPTSLRASLPPFLAFTGEDYEPNQPEYGVWPPGCLWPSLVK